MSKINSEDISSDINSEDNQDNKENQDNLASNSDYSVHHSFKNSKSQDIRIKNFNTMILKDIETPKKNISKRPRMKSMFISNSNFFWKKKNKY